MAFRRLQGRPVLRMSSMAKSISTLAAAIFSKPRAGWQHLARPWCDLLPRRGAGADEARQIRQIKAARAQVPLQPLGPGAAIDLEGAAQVARPDQAVQLVELPALAAGTRCPASR